MKDKQLVVEAIRMGSVIDHISPDRTLLAVELLTRPEDEYLVGVNLPSTTMKRKGIIKIPGKVLSDSQLELLAAVAPGCTVNIIEDYQIVRKFIPAAPERIVGVFACANQNCITNHEPVPPVFRHRESGLMCQYCERIFPVQRLKALRPSR